jgi:phosphoesterase RecJ-like protein
LNKFADTLRQNRRFLISTHVQPDGDGIGSEIALYHHLKKTGKEAWVINPSPTPEKFEVIDPSRIIQVFSSGLKVPDVDTVIIVDTNEVKMLGALAPVVENLKVPILFVDHHVKELQDTSGHLIDEKSGSSGEIVYRFIKSQGTELTFEMAQALYVAILTDTGNFRFQRTSPSTHETVADLLRTGVKPEQVFQSVFGKDSAEKLRLLGKTLQTLKLECQGQFAWVSISKSDRDQSQATIEDTESFIGHLTVLRDVKIVALFREEDNGTTKLSLRGLHNQPVVEIAKKFGGGGHKFAAGAKIQKPIQETIDLVLKEVSSKL